MDTKISKKYFLLQNWIKLDWFTSLQLDVGVSKQWILGVSRIWQLSKIYWQLEMYATVKSVKYILLVKLLNKSLQIEIFWNLQEPQFDSCQLKLLKLKLKALKFIF